MKTNEILNQIKSKNTDSNLFNNTFTISGTNINNKNITFIKDIKLFGISVYKKLTEISVNDFFKRVGKNKQTLKIMDKIIDKYLARIKKAELMGQTDLVEQLKDNIEVVKREALAITYGITEYVTAEQIDKLLNKSSKYIELTFIKNYLRYIPDELLELKVKLDEENIFDDYVVAHYDPKKENTSLTKKEIEKKKDPILFGLIKGSTNFYYIGDWIDEYCNLTLKEFVTIIEEDTKKIGKE